MTEFYQEITPGGYGIAIKRKKTLFSEQSPFQKVEVFESDSTLGRVLTLDDLMMTTEGDEFHYHEMIAHIPMMHHKSPKTVLVIGGGDGGTVREVLKHDTVEKVILCEIDGMVIDACKKYLPTISCELDNPKCEILVEDAIEYMKKVFPIRATYTSNIPTYPGGYWAWAFCSETVEPLSYWDERRGDAITKTCKIYNKDYHNARFALPNYLKELL